MVSMNMASLVSGIKLSSVVPAKVAGNNKTHELSNMDLAMKLHYIKGVYFFKSEAVQGLSIDDLKKPMFLWLEKYYIVSGRIRKSESGRPFIKCNDAGVRIVEAYCEKTIDEWLAMDDRSLDNCLAYNQVLGPDLGFSPLVFVQFTWFKCGGMSVGLSWAHVLGDALSASTFINMWGQIMAGHVPQNSLHVPNIGKSEFPASMPGKQFSMKKVDPVGDHWLTSNNSKMETLHFHVSAEQLDHIISKVYDPNPNQASNMSHFEVLSAIIWKSLSKIREDSGPRNVTICTNGPRARENEIATNGMVLKKVEADFSVAKGDISELAMLIAGKKVDEITIIEETLIGDKEKSDFIVYGANLTFVDLGEANIYGLELKGKRPAFVNYTFDGVGDEGVVLVLPGPKEEGGIGRRVTMVLPENQLAQLINELKKVWGLV